MKYEDIQRVSAKLKTTDVKGKPYVEVNERVKAFRELFPEGVISTELLKFNEDGCVVRAVISDSNGKILASGLSHERTTFSPINKTSCVENAETSAVGRALGFLGIGIDTAICSSDELNNAIQKSVELDAEAKIILEQIKKFVPDFTKKALANPKNKAKGWTAESDFTIEYLKKSLNFYQERETGETA